MGQPAKKGERFLLPCSLYEFMKDIYEDCSFIGNRDVYYPHNVHRLAQTHGTMLAKAFYYSEDKSIFLYDYQTLLEVETSLPNVQRRWTIMASQLSYNKFAAGTNDYCVVPLHILTPYLEKAPLACGELEQVFGSYKGVVKSSKNLVTKEMSYTIEGEEIDEKTFNDLAKEFKYEIERNNYTDLEYTLHGDNLACIVYCTDYMLRLLESFILSELVTVNRSPLPVHLLETGEPSADYHFILPCPMRSFFNQIASDYAFEIEPQSTYKPKDNVLFTQFCTGADLPMWRSTDLKIMVYDHGGFVSVWTNIPELKELWTYKAFVLSINSNSPNKGRGFFTSKKMFDDFIAIEYPETGDTTKYTNTQKGVIAVESLTDGSAYFYINNKEYISEQEYIWLYNKKMYEAYGKHYAGTYAIYYPEFNIYYVEPHCRTIAERIINSLRNSYIKALGKTLDKNLCAKNSKSFVLPVNIREFCNTIAPEIMFECVPDSIYSEEYNFIIAQQGLPVYCPKYANEDNSVIAYDYGRCVLVETNLQSKSDLWTSSALELQATKLIDAINTEV